MAEFTLAITPGNYRVQTLPLALPMLSTGFTIDTYVESLVEYVPVWENNAFILDPSINRDGYISGVVKAGEVPMEKVRVNLNYRKTGGLIRTAFTAADGTFSFRCGLNNASAEYMVVVEGPPEIASVLVDNIVPNNVTLAIDLTTGAVHNIYGADYSAYVAAVGAVHTSIVNVGVPPTPTTITNLALATEGSKAIRTPLMRTLLTQLGTLGSTEITGILKKTDYPVAREIRLYARASGELVTSTFSDMNGAFTLTGAGPGDYYITAHDFGTIDNKAIIRNITI